MGEDEMSPKWFDIWYDENYGENAAIHRAESYSKELFIKKVQNRIEYKKKLSAKDKVFFNKRDYPDLDNFKKILNMGEPDRKSKIKELLPFILGFDMDIYKTHKSCGMISDEIDPSYKNFERGLVNKLDEIYDSVSDICAHTNHMIISSAIRRREFKPLFEISMIEIQIGPDRNFIDKNGHRLYVQNTSGTTLQDGILKLQFIEEQLKGLKYNFITSDDT